MTSTPVRLAALRIIGISAIYPDAGAPAPVEATGGGAAAGRAPSGAAAAGEAAPVEASGGGAAKATDGHAAEAKQEPADDAGHDHPATDRELLAAERLGDDLAVAAIPDTNILQLRFAHPNRAVAARVLNTMIAVYMEKRADIYEHADMRAMMREQQRYAARLRDANSELASFARTSGISNYDEQISLLLNEADRIRAASRAAADRLKALGAPPDAARRVTVPQPPGGATLGETLQQMVARRRAILEKGGADPAAIVEIDSRIAAVRAAIARNGGGASADLLTRAAAPPRLEASESEREILQAEIANLQEAANRNQIERDVLTTADGRYRELKRARDILEQSSNSFDLRVEQARVADGLDPFRLADVRVIQAADPPPVGHRPIAPVMAAGALAGLASAMIVLAALSGRRRVLISGPGAAAELGMPVLLAIPERRLIEDGLTPRDPRRDGAGSYPGASQAL